MKTSVWFLLMLHCQAPLYLNSCFSSTVDERWNLSLWYERWCLIKYKSICAMKVYTFWRPFRVSPECIALYAVERASFGLRYLACRLLSRGSRNANTCFNCGFRSTRRDGVWFSFLTICLNETLFHYIIAHISIRVAWGSGRLFVILSSEWSW